MAMASPNLGVELLQIAAEHIKHKPVPHIIPLHPLHCLVQIIHIHRLYHRPQSLLSPQL